MKLAKDRNLRPIATTIGVNADREIPPRSRRLVTGATGKLVPDRPYRFGVVGMVLAVWVIRLEADIMFVGGM